MEKIYIVYGNLNRLEDQDYKVHGAYRSPFDAKEFAEKLAEKSAEELGAGEVEFTANPNNVGENVIYGFTVNDWEVEIYVAEIQLK